MAGPKKKKKTKIIVRLQSTVSAYFKTVYKNARNSTKIAKKMFDPVVRKHVLFEEKKVHKGK